MRVAIIDNRMPNELTIALSSYADKILRLPPHPLLPSPVASHPDMLLWICERVVVTYADYLSVAKSVFDFLEELGYTVVTEKKSPGSTYPHDIALNCALVGNKIIANQKHMSEKIRDIAREKGLQTVAVKQGYAKCSTVTVSDDAIITADPSIAEAAAAAGVYVLKICPDHVSLDGYNTGFLGGASGYTQTEVIFCGNLDDHPDVQAIKNFCSDHKKNAVSLGSTPLYDYGTVFFADKQD